MIVIPKSLVPVLRPIYKQESPTALEIEIVPYQLTGRARTPFLFGMVAGQNQIQPQNLCVGPGNGRVEQEASVRGF